MWQNYLAGLVDGLDMGNNTKVETLLFDTFQIKKNVFHVIILSYGLISFSYFLGGNYEDWFAGNACIL
jgi:hypothetical protein